MRKIRRCFKHWLGWPGVVWFALAGFGGFSLVWFGLAWLGLAVFACFPLVWFGFLLCLRSCVLACLRAGLVGLIWFGLA